MNNSAQERRLRLAAGAALLFLSLTSCGTTTAAPPESAPVPSPSQSSAAPAQSSPSAEAPPSSAVDAPPDGPGAMDPSAPVSFAIPTLDRQAKVIETGLREDNTLEVPPENEGAPASWYNGSPTPGEQGPAVLLGHVNSTADESGVFYNLEALKAGDRITVNREDGSTAVFEVYKSEVYPKNEFPTRAVYFPVDQAELRLITCDGFAASSGEFEDNLVVYAKLVDTA
ncbi:hypothetical protein GCM10027404_06380 [Arthrobacter tumbae]|uniref:class F sortase n=1 Tax=Arthrobacter tumbae TaxID=163874 RepID=UPI001956EF0C|nr:class F sortase [Arthrobacter tumbae]MBM7779918.1 LPXTG-site transpeptidase (sortase) family protein [Arthrobacter tumbae]